MHRHFDREGVPGPCGGTERHIQLPGLDRIKDKDGEECGGVSLICQSSQCWSKLRSMNIITEPWGVLGRLPLI